MAYIAGSIGNRAGSGSKEEKGAILGRMGTALSHRSNGHSSHVLLDNGFLISGNEFGITPRCYFADTDTGMHVIMDGEIYDVMGDTIDIIEHNTDARILGELYIKHGLHCAEMLDGIYAAAIWEDGPKRLTLLRDRLGVKPLFYYYTKGQVLFASEVKGIVASQKYHPKADPRSVDLFLSYGYIPAPHTLFEGVKQLPPASYARFHGGECEVKRYWRLGELEIDIGDPETRIDRFEELLRRAVEKRVKRHPDAGAFLSGGLDTGTTVAMRCQVQESPFPVFTAGFREQGYNEIPEAELIAKHFGLPHQTVVVEFENDFMGFLEKLVWHHDGPFADTSAIPSYHVASLARQHVDTVFTGDFPDQMLGGSGHYIKSLVGEASDNDIRRLFRMKPLAHFIRSLPMAAGTAGFMDRLKRAVYRETFSYEEQRVLLDMPAQPLLKRSLYTKDFYDFCRDEDPLELAWQCLDEAPKPSLLDRLLYFDMHYYAPDDLMVKVDRMSCAHGLCTVSPFHDPDLVGFSWGLPPNWKIRGNERKYILRRVAAKYLPMSVLEKKKQGFAMPIGRWLVQKLGNQVEELLCSPNATSRGYFKPHFLRGLVSRFLKGETDYASGSEGLVIALITLEMWHRLFVDICWVKS